MAIHFPKTIYPDSSMAILPIVTAPNPVLKMRAAPVAAVDERIRGLMDDMIETLRAERGIGLAAPQVGVSERVVVIDLGLRDSGAAMPLRLVNPEIVWASAETALGREACLSVPDQAADVARAKSVRVRHLDQNGVSCEVEASGLLAVCLQHEIDHLDGRLYIDRLSAVRRDIMLRKARKRQRDRAAM